jgi:hypothetical protein
MMDEFHSLWVSDICGWINFIHEQWAKLYMKIVVVLVLHHSLLVYVDVDFPHFSHFPN